MLNISSTNIGLESVTMIATSSLFDEHKILSSLDLLKLSEESKKKLAEIGLEVPALDDKKAMFTLVFDNLITQLPGGTHTFVLSASDEMGHETVQTIYYCQFANHDSSGSRIGGVGTFCYIEGICKERE